MFCIPKLAQCHGDGCTLPAFRLHHITGLPGFRVRPNSQRYENPWKFTIAACTGNPLEDAGVDFQFNTEVTKYL